MSRTIEQIISQKKFESAHQKATLALLIAGGVILNKHTEFLKGYDITSQQYNVLRILRGNYPKPCTILTIRDRMVDRMSDVSRIVERLRKADLVIRSSSEADRRAVDVVISEKGLALLKTIGPSMSELLQLGDLTDEEAETLSSLIERVL